MSDTSSKALPPGPTEPEPAPAPSQPEPGAGQPAAEPRSAMRQSPPAQRPAQPAPTVPPPGVPGPAQLAPRPASAWPRRWPGPSAAAGPAVLTGTAAAATVSAASIPLDRPGLGWLLAGAGFLLTVAGAAWSAGRSGGTGAPEEGSVEFAGGKGPRRVPTGLDPARWVWALATVALLGVGTIRAAGWLFVLCLLTAAVTGSLAVAGGRSVRGLLLAVLLPPVAAVRSLPWAARGMARLGRGRGNRSPGRIVATAAVSFGLLVVFGALFTSADAAFADLLAAVLPEIGPGAVFRTLFLFPLAALGLVGAAFLVVAPPDLTGLEAAPTGRVRRLEWVVPLTLLNMLFAAFVLVQVRVLFGGAAHVLDESGPTFADYARSGFWQLLLVTALTLVVLGGAARWAPRDTRTDRVLIRVLLGALAVLTLVIVASALNRMHTYQQAYGFTRLRILVSACELWLGLLFTLVLAAGVRLRAAWLPRLVVGSAVLALLGLAVLNPDRFIAERNIDRYETNDRIDVAYLSGLSADAVPALDRLPGRLRDCALAELAAELSGEPDDWRGWNAARARARDLLAADRPVRPSHGCPSGSPVR